jgi:2-oxoglutarate ferredoxin oxidoreductase subunit beta
MKTNPLHKYLRDGSLPHFFCPGCGAAQVMNFFLVALDDLNMDLQKMVCIGGVGCTARIPVYLKVDALHGIHGRTLPWATGIKLTNPELKVVIFAGDGDAAAIGGNHLIQAARRNLDVTMIVVNNLTYGMTGGQVAPTTHKNLYSLTTPYGNPEPNFDLIKLIIAAGGTFASRWTTAAPRQSINAIKKALNHKGFSLVEIVAQCPTYFGRKALKTGEPVQGLNWIKENSYLTQKAETMSAEEKIGKFELGNFIQKDAPVFMGSSYINHEDD